MTTNQIINAIIQAGFDRAFALKAIAWVGPFITRIKPSRIAQYVRDNEYAIRQS
jgi:hypothetical protein